MSYMSLRILPRLTGPYQLRTCHLSKPFRALSVSNFQTRVYQFHSIGPCIASHSLPSISWPNGLLSARKFCDVPPETGNLTQKQRLKRAIKDYGTTVVVFHVAISLMSLGTSYLAISGGLDLVFIMDYMGIALQKTEATAGTFVIAYAVHKVFAPARIAITLTATPFIVKYLRGIKILKVKN